MTRSTRSREWSTRPTLRRRTWPRGCPRAPSSRSPSERWDRPAPRGLQAAWDLRVLWPGQRDLLASPDQRVPVDCPVIRVTGGCLAHLGTRSNGFRLQDRPLPRLRRSRQGRQPGGQKWRPGRGERERGLGRLRRGRGRRGRRGSVGRGRGPGRLRRGKSGRGRRGSVGRGAGRGVVASLAGSGECLVVVAARLTSQHLSHLRILGSRLPLLPTASTLEQRSALLLRTRSPSPMQQRSTGPLLPRSMWSLVSDSTQDLGSTGLLSSIECPAAHSRPSCKRRRHRRESRPFLSCTRRISRRSQDSSLGRCIRERRTARHTRRDITALVACRGERVE